MTSMRAFVFFGLAFTLIASTPLPGAFAADTTPTSSHKHDTAKGAAVGALAGHEMGSGHAVAGAGVGAAVGHHEKKKAERSGN